MLTFGRHGRKSQSLHVQSMHERKETCTLWQGKKARTTRNMSEVCTNTRKHAHFGRHGRKNVLFMSEVCTKERKHALSGREKGTNHEKHVRSVHKHQKTRTLRQAWKEKPLSSCPNYARKKGNMHTSAGEKGTNHQKACTLR